jgi:hypothetical protein
MPVSDLDHLHFRYVLTALGALAAVALALLLFLRVG